MPKSACTTRWLRAACTFRPTSPMISETRQFLAVYLEPNTTTAIGPIPWTPPALPPANDHYCLYLRVLSGQATPPVETMNIDSDVANNNNLAWRNIKVVAPGDTEPAELFHRPQHRPRSRAAGAAFRSAGAVDEAGRHRSYQARCRIEPRLRSRTGHHDGPEIRRQWQLRADKPEKRDHRSAAGAARRGARRRFNWARSSRRFRATSPSSRQAAPASTAASPSVSPKNAERRAQAA